MRKEIRIAGFGGQGVITIGVLLAKALGQFGGVDVAQTQSYGPEARGGACKTDVVFSDEEIDYIKPLALDGMAVMSQPALDCYASGLSDSGLLLLDSTLVEKIPPRFMTVWNIPATSLAEEKLGTRVVANVVMFGALAKATGWTTDEACKKALADTSPEQFLDKNYAAFDLGYTEVSRENA
ncbi:MAG: 2-oxoacid:acceptor oxidoreductase family protein [Desulfovibrio sp.]|jgi:2-oxoglutarate ferredoxin oxidoreductase subunit gamma|nr:2-oxoacid:acceptor oxidoreductase family protein [Desulfovibrio sp.]